MAEIVHLKADATEEDILSVIDRDAAVILDDVLNADLLNQIKDELDPYLNSYIKGKTEFTGFETKRVGGLLARSLGCQDLALHPLINSLACNFLKPYGDGYQLHFTSAVSIGPGETNKYFIEIEEFGEDIYQEKLKHISVQFGL